VLLEGETAKREVYQVVCPATSVFGDGEKGKLPLQAYGRHLKAHNTPVISVVTELRFDTASPTPKLVFKPLRPITENEHADVMAARNTPEADEAIKLSVVSKPKGGATPAPAPKVSARAPVEKVKAEEVEEVEEVEEPKKVEKKPTSAATAAPALAELVDGWDD
jgi:hypothetical protein